MRVAKSKLMIFVFLLIALLTYSFPLSSVFRMLCIMSFGGYIILSNLSVKINVKNMYMYSLLLFIVWGGVSYIWAAYSVGVSDQLFNMISAIIVNITITIYIIKSKESLEEIYSWLMPVLLIYLIQSIIIGDFGSQGRFSITGSVNQYGITISYIFLLSLYAFKNKKYNKVISSILVVLSATMSLLTGSRKTLVNLVIFVCMIYLFSNYDKSVIKNIGRVLVIAFIGIIALLLVLKVDFLYQYIGNRIETLISFYQGDVNQDLSALRREYMKDDAINLFLKNPLLGVGLNNFKYITRYDTYAHSNYYEMLSCLGIIGTMLYYIPVLIISVLSFNQWKRNEKNAVVPLAIMISFVINEFSNVSYMYRNIHVFLGLTAGIIFAAEERYRKSIKSENTSLD